MERSKEPPIRCYKYFTIAKIDENVVSFVLAERNRPLGIFMAKESEFLSFPTINCVQTRARPLYLGWGKLFCNLIRPVCPL